ACGGKPSPSVVNAAVGSVDASAPTPTSPPAVPATVPSPTTTTAAPPPPPPSPALAQTRPKVVVSPTGVVLSVTGIENGAVKVLTPCENSALVDRGTPVKGASVVLDAGHGGKESGAVGPNGLAEKTANLAVTRATKVTL